MSPFQIDKSSGGSPFLAIMAGAPFFFPPSLSNHPPPLLGGMCFEDFFFFHFL